MKRLLILLLILLLFPLLMAVGEGPNEWSPPSASSGSGTPSGAEINSPEDRDGDGSPDWVLVQGDYNGDGNINPKDINEAVKDLTDTGPKLVRVEGGPYRIEDGFADTTAWNADAENSDGCGIVLSDDTTLDIAKGTEIRGWEDFTNLAAAFPTSWALICNDTLPAGDNATPTYRITIQGGGYVNGGLDYGPDGVRSNGDEPYDHALATQLTGQGIYLRYCVDCFVQDIEIANTSHQCLYVQNARNMIVQRNFIHGCGAWDAKTGTEGDTVSQDTAAGSAYIPITASVLGNYTPAPDSQELRVELDDGTWQQFDVGYVDTTNSVIQFPEYGVPDPPVLRDSVSATNRVYIIDDAAFGGTYCYSLGGIGCDNYQVIDNVFDDIGSTAIHVRAAAAGSHATNIVVRNNSVTNVAQFCMDMSGVRGGSVVSNYCYNTRGFDTYSPGSAYCSEDPTEQDCSTSVSIDNLILRQNRSGNGHSPFDLDGYNEQWNIDGLTIDGTTRGPCMAITSEPGGFRRSTFANVVLKDCAWHSIANTTATSAVAADLAWTNLTLDGNNLFNPFRAFQFAMVEITQNNDIARWTIDGFRVRRPGGPIWEQTGSVDSIDIHNVDIDARRIGFLGEFEELTLNSTYPCNWDNRGKWAITTNASDENDDTLTSGTASARSKVFCHGDIWRDEDEGGGYCNTDGRQHVEEAYFVDANDTPAACSSTVPQTSGSADGIDDDECFTYCTSGIHTVRDFEDAHAFDIRPGSGDTVSGFRIHSGSIRNLDTCTNLYNDVGRPQTSGSPDTLCDFVGGNPTALAAAGGTAVEFDNADAASTVSNSFFTDIHLESTAIGVINGVTEGLDLAGPGTETRVVGDLINCADGEEGVADCIVGGVGGATGASVFLFAEGPGGASVSTSLSSGTFVLLDSGGTTGLTATIDNSGEFTVANDEMCYAGDDPVTVGVVVAFSISRTSGASNVGTFALAVDTTGGHDDSSTRFGPEYSRAFTSGDTGMGAIEAATTLDTDDCVAIVGEATTTADFDVEAIGFYVTEP